MLFSTLWSIYEHLTVMILFALKKCFGLVEWRFGLGVHLGSSKVCLNSSTASITIVCYFQIVKLNGRWICAAFLSFRGHSASITILSGLVPAAWFLALASTAVFDDG